MADKGDDGLLGCGALIVGALAVGWFVTKPASDQVCRQADRGWIDRMHGIQWQPTCQQYIAQVERRAIAAERKALEAAAAADDLELRRIDLESRLSAVEDKLLM